MSTLDVSQLLRPGLLYGISAMVAGLDTDAETTFAGAIIETCRRLGASVLECGLGVGGSVEVAEARVDAEVQRMLGTQGGLDLLAVDAAGLFARAQSTTNDGDGGDDALNACLQESWNVTRAVANRAFLDGGGGGRVVYVAPTPDAGIYADAARAGLENLARTLSIEWARHAVTAVAIAPGARTGAGEEVAALSAYLASPAGAYFSGCLLDLRGPAAAS
jgi:NAD(P)-dependent dehydrogenase (short-subunit alcohol dehydrogenase family)